MDTIDLKDKELATDRKYWIAVVGQSRTEPEFLSQGWWCIQDRAKVGDLILAYRTTKADKNNSGIFALCRILGKPHDQTGRSELCSRFGKQFGALFYTEIKILTEFSIRLSLREMKADPILRNEQCTVRNLQGTTFELSPKAFHRILDLVKPRNISPLKNVEHIIGV